MPLFFKSMYLPVTWGEQFCLLHSAFALPPFAECKSLLHMLHGTKFNLTVTTYSAYTCAFICLQKSCNKVNLVAIAIDMAGVDLMLRKFIVIKSLYWLFGRQIRRRRICLSLSCCTEQGAEAWRLSKHIPNN